VVYKGAGSLRDMAGLRLLGNEHLQPGGVYYVGDFVVAGRTLSSDTKSYGFATVTTTRGCPYLARSESRIISITWPIAALESCVAIVGVIKDLHAPTRVDRSAVGPAAAFAAEAEYGTQGDPWRSPLHRGRPFPSEDGNAVARSAREIWAVEERLQPVRELGTEGALGDDFPGAAA
jgi:hypothetical protein